MDSPGNALAGMAVAIWRIGIEVARHRSRSRKNGFDRVDQSLAAWQQDMTTAQQGLWAFGACAGDDQRRAEIRRLFLQAAGIADRETRTCQQCDKAKVVQRRCQGNAMVTTKYLANRFTRSRVGMQRADDAERWMAFEQVEQ